MSASKVYHATLDNGLKLIGECMPSAQSAAIGFFVRTGSRDELPDESGISHFLEHMMFKGTAKRSALDLTYAFGAIGAQANAFTTEESTVFYAGVLPEFFAELQEILSDMLSPALDRAEFDTEKRVILEEIALYLDRPQFWLYEQACLDYYGGHPAGNSVLGTQASVSAISPEMMAAYFKRRYVPSGIVCVAAGDFDWDSFVARAQAYCGAWAAAPAERGVTTYPAREIKRVYRRKQLNQAHLLLLSEGASLQDEERYAFAVLSTLLGDVTGSKIYWGLIDSGLAESAGCDNDEKDGTGCFSVYASTEPTKLSEVLRIIAEILARPLDFSRDELEMARTKLEARVVMSGELPMGRLMALGGTWLGRHEIHDLRATAAKLKGVQRNHLAAALEKYPLRKMGEFQLLPED